MTFMLNHKARLQCAGLLVPAAVALCASPAAVNAAGEPAAARSRAVEYSVINLGPDAGMTVLNRRGQAAFATWSPDEIVNGFFDGQRVHTLPSLGGSFTFVRGLNDQGVVVGQSQDASLDYRAFSWTAARGMRALPGPTLADANAINNRNQVVGGVRAQPQSFYTRASRWDPNGTLTSLGPLPARISTAWAINDSGVSVGDSEVQFQDSHAMVWDAAGKATDLGKFGGSQSTAKQINASGQVLGTYYKDGRGIGFLWSRTQGMLRIGPDSGAQYVTALNDNGEVAGNNLVANGDPAYLYRPFLWAAGRGMRPLPVAGALDARVLALNNRREMVGYLERTLQDALSRRAVLWSDVANPVDLNTRLYRAPAGLVLYAANAINDDGAIVADSSAGLVLLRPGKEGTAAPVLGAIAGGAADDAVMTGGTVDFTVNFVDSAVAESHAASSSVNDACPQATPSLRERRGTGDISLRHTFCKAGAFTVKIKVTDRAGNATQVQRRVTVTDPAALAGTGAPAVK
jgi:probable HAF family extracellular repeat protein